MDWRYRILGEKHESIFKLSPKAQKQFLIKSRTRKDMGAFSAGPINKAVPNFTNSLTRVRER